MDASRKADPVEVGATAGEVLLAEDSDLDAERIERAFASLGVRHPIRRARDGVEAIARLEAAAGGAARAPARMLLDLNMPRVNGIEVLEACAARPELPIPPVLVMSTSARSFERHAERLAAHECLVKPPTLAETVRALAESASIGSLATRDDLVLVDDDPDVHELARRLVRRTPRRLVGLHGVGEARARLADREVELLIVDARMPDGSGLDLLEGLAADGAPGAARTVLSSAGPLQPADRARAEALGVEVIVKGELFDRATFAERIERRVPRAA